MGRPKKEFTPEQIEQIKTLARCHCPDTEIAAFMGCEESTIKRRFAPLIKDAREAGKANIRAKQFRLAMDGNVPMLIWIGKQILKQSDKHEWDIKGVPEDKFSEEVARRLKDAARK